MLSENDLRYLVSTSGAGVTQARAVIELLDEGMTVPFIARYRKEKTGDLDEVAIIAVKDLHDYIVELNERKETILKTIEEQGKLTDELKQAIGQTYTKNELEDLYLPYKPKRRTKATIAREKGLEPLTLTILDPMVPGPDISILAESYINPEVGIGTVSEAIEGAEHILLEFFSELPEIRKRLRREMYDNGDIVVNVSEEWAGKRSKYEQYYDHREKVKSIPSHRFLAIRRGELEKVLACRIEIEREQLFTDICRSMHTLEHPRASWLDTVVQRALARRVMPSLELEILADIKVRADEEAINVFAKNLENILLGPPAGTVRVLAVDPGFRTGCKVVVLDETGKLLDTTTIFPTKPREDLEGATRTVVELLNKHYVRAIVIGNGTASRETRAFMKAIAPSEVTVTVVSEAGASIYSASDLAREEFPDYDVTVRGAVSIGRRFQDPLSELVKIDPKSIGVGQYQHDVHQGLLKKKLDIVVTSVVNRVGVDLNTASQQLLRYVSGIGDSLSKNIIAYRDTHGLFSQREEILNVRLFGAKAYQQSVGFLRIRNGDNILDETGIHPEAYSIVIGMAKDNNTTIASMIGNAPLLKSLVPDRYITVEFGLPTVRDILAELENPGRDPRKDFEHVDFNDEVMELEDLTNGMILNGIVTNVTKFGAFVDIGVHQDGLVHISQLSTTYVTNPDDVIAVGDKVSVKVLSVDLELKRIQLSIKEASRTQQPHNTRSGKPASAKAGTEKLQMQTGKARAEKPHTKDLLADLKLKWRSV